MQLSEEQRYKIVQFIIDLYKNEMIANNGEFTERAKQKQEDFGSSRFKYCVAGDVPIGRYIEENNMTELLKCTSSLWTLYDKDRCAWNWLFLLLTDTYINNDAKFEEVLALNRKLYGIEKTKTSLEKAADLLDDSDEFEDI